MTPGSFNIEIVRSATWDDLIVTWRDSAGALVDLTGATATMTIYLDGTLTTTIPTTTGTMLLGGVFGTIKPSLSAAQTTALVDEAYRYSLAVQNAGRVDVLLEGQVNVRSTP